MEPFSFYLFGVTGNLAQIKVIPAIYDLFEKGRIAKGTPIIGVARKEMSANDFRSFVWDILHIPNKSHQHTIKDDVWEMMASSLSYIQGDFSDPSLYATIHDQMQSRPTQNAIYYLATYPQLYETIFHQLKQHQLTNEKDGFKRLLVEKPFGIDLPSAQNLNALMASYFAESQVYRLDHYLGKETLQNILTFRFGNGLLEPLFSHEYVDHIQISAMEDIGIGRRGTYFDSVGMLKDVGQNHSLQMLTLLTMDAPSAFTNEEVTKRRVEILKNIIPDPSAVVFGQYDGYLGEEFVAPQSSTETFFALRTTIDVPRWQGVPIYIRAGKRVQQSCTEISLVFKTPTNRLFKHLESGMEPNVLTFRIQPNEGIVLRFLSKKPGHELEVESQAMQFCYRLQTSDLPDAYERLIADVVEGDQTFFNDAIEVEAQWEFTDALMREKRVPFLYSQQSWGPEASMDLLAADGRSWLEPSSIVCAIE